MSRRRLSPRTASRNPPRITERIEDKSDGQWHVRPLSGAGATKPYRCPGCDHIITMGTPHTVVWPVEKSLLSASAIDERRHWHTNCWRRKR